MSQDVKPDAQPWTILRLLEWTRKFFEGKGIDDARLEAELLLAHALTLQRMQLYMQHDRIVAEPQLSAFRDLVKRRSQHVPTQYLLGEACFRNLTLKVTPAVLVPRPETEILVDEALELICPKKRPAWKFERGEFVDHRGEAEQPELVATSDTPAPPASPRVLDLCTGSGCIALAIAAECPQAAVVATDLSAEALAVARENAALCRVTDRVTFLEGDLFAALAALAESDRVFDLITANPPYISEGEMADLMPEVRDHEPRLALAAGPEGLDVIDRLLDGAATHLAPGRSLLMEIGYNQAARLRERAAELTDLELVSIRKDLGGHERVVQLRKR
jgi:release factor glutamine methyltransferase